MTNEEMLREIASLPAFARQEVEDFVAFLTARHHSASASVPGSIEAEDFVGIWRDRDEMGDSSNWVRDVREKHWAN